MEENETPVVVAPVYGVKGVKQEPIRVIPEVPPNVTGYLPLTRAEQFWEWAGWERPVAPVLLPPQVDGYPGWTAQRVNIQLTWGQRLRLLFTGRLQVGIGTRLDVVPTRVLDISVAQILHPGRGFDQ